MKLELRYHNEFMRIRIKKLHPDAVLPALRARPRRRRRAWICVRSNAWCSSRAWRRAFQPESRSSCPPGYEAQVRPRSGMALKHSITVNFGTIDPGYRGEIRVVMFNLGASRLRD